MQEAFDSWDMLPVPIPARSRLHSIEPIGVGTPFVESLTGYMIRLAASHAVRVSDLIEHELRTDVPYYHGQREFRTQSTASERAPRTGSLRSNGLLYAIIFAS